MIFTGKRAIIWVLGFSFVQSMAQGYILDTLDLCYLHNAMTDPKKPIPPFMFRLRPEYRKMLDQTSNLERRSRASILEDLIKKNLPQRIKEGGDQP